MSATHSDEDPLQPTGPDWIAAGVAGVVSAIIVSIALFGIDADIIETDIPNALDMSGAGAGFALVLVVGIVAGIVYGALNAVGAIDEWASTAQTGAILGLGYGLVLWAVAVVLVPLIQGDGVDAIGDYAVTFEGILAFALMGVLIGFIYLLVPVLRTR